MNEEMLRNLRLKKVEWAI